VFPGGCCRPAIWLVFADVMENKEKKTNKSYEDSQFLFFLHHQPAFTSNNQCLAQYMKEFFSFGLV
jgi:hypothetical protein